MLSGEENRTFMTDDAVDPSNGPGRVRMSTKAITGTRTPIFLSAERQID